MRQEILQKILEKIEAYDRIILFRHLRNDGDCVGSTKGLKSILQASFPEKEVYICDETEPAEYLRFLGPDEDVVTDEMCTDALAIVLDTGTQERIASPKFRLCRELIKIDHHINIEPYGDPMWVEAERSSACEMVAEFYRTFSDRLTLPKDAAFDLYTGMVTDSGRFRFSDVSGETLRLAGMLLDQGIDTERLFANLYLDEFAALKFKAALYERMQISPNGVAYLFVDKAMQKEFDLTIEKASNSVSAMDSIRGSLCWLAFIETDENIRVRLRSRFMHINTLAEQYRGGGHACASGATVYSWDEAKELIGKADEMIRDYKEHNEGWL